MLLSYVKIQAQNQNCFKITGFECRMFVLEQFDGRCGCDGAFYRHYAPHSNKLCIRVFVQHDWRPNCGRCILPIGRCFAAVDGQCGNGAFVSVSLPFIVMVEEVGNLFKYFNMWNLGRGRVNIFEKKS